MKEDSLFKKEKSLKKEISAIKMKQNCSKVEYGFAPNTKRFTAKEFGGQKERITPKGMGYFENTMTEFKYLFDFEGRTSSILSKEIFQSCFKRMRDKVILDDSFGRITRQKSGSRIEKPCPIYPSSVQKKNSELKLQKKRSSQRILSLQKIEETKNKEKEEEKINVTDTNSKETRWKKDDDRR